MDLWYTEKHTENVHFTLRVKEHLYHSISKYQEIDVFETYEFGKVLTLDGFVMVTEKDEFIYHEMITHVPLATNPNIKSVLVIGGGDGGTLKELCRYKTIDTIDFVEIDEEVVEVSKKYFKTLASSFDDPRVNIFYDDGLSFISSTQTIYDLIIVDSTDPIGVGEGLFSKAFYDNCYQSLSEEGILINQHESPYYDKDSKEMKRSHAKIKSTFDISMVYQFHMPTYPSGHWLFGFSSKKFHPIHDLSDDWKELNLKTKYYNPQIHIGSFYLPNYVQEMLDNV
jgi:spermidine synthase